MADDNLPRPDGIDEDHAAPPRRRHASPASLILIGTLLAASLTGVLGGQPHPVKSAANAAVRLTLAAPETLRSGMFFETRVRIEPRRPIGEVVLAISPVLWRDITINSAIPAPEKEAFADGMIRMSYGKGEPGKPIEIKFDGQVNPPLIGANAGEVAVYDGDQRLIAIRADKRVLP